MNELIDRARTAYEHVEKCRASKSHRELWKLILTGRWYEALEDTQEDFGLQTVRGLVWLLLNHYESKKSKNPKSSIKYIRQFYELIENRSEQGRIIRLELESLAIEWNLGTEEQAQSKILHKRSKKKPARNHEDLILVDESVSCTDTLDKNDKDNKENDKDNKESDKDNKENDKDNKENDKNKNALSTRATSRPASRPYGRTHVLYPAQYKSFARSQREDRLRESIPIPHLPDDPREWLSDGEMRSNWIVYIDEIARRYPVPLSPREIHRISEAPLRFCNSVFKEWKGLLAKGITEQDRRGLAIALSMEAEAIAREAMLLATSSEDDRVSMAGLKLALDSLDRRTSLLGLDKIALEMTVSHKGLSWEAQAKEAGLTDQDLKAIGDIASKALSQVTK